MLSKNFEMICSCSCIMLLEVSKPGFWFIGTARIVCRAGSMKRYRVCPSRTC